MATVTYDIRQAKEHVVIRPSTLRDAKRRAHRTHRRAWRQYLHLVTRTGHTDDLTEARLQMPRLTGYDLS